MSRVTRGLTFDRWIEEGNAEADTYERENPDDRCVVCRDLIAAGQVVCPDCEARIEAEGSTP